MEKTLLLSITGILLTITGMWDGYKYHWSAMAIRKAKTARGQSRKFINAALSNNIIRIVHCFILPDWWLVISSLFALIFMFEHWWAVYIYYPYRYRGLIGFKKPNIIIYMFNSILPNRLRKRL